MVAEQFEILRRITERGRERAFLIPLEHGRKEFVDIFQHLLNNIEVTKKAYGQETTQNEKDPWQIYYQDREKRKEKR